jgi:hypothetical protein
MKKKIMEYEDFPEEVLAFEGDFRGGREWQLMTVVGS